MSKKSKLFRNIMVSAAVITSFAAPVRAEDEISMPLHVRIFDDGECTFLSISSEITVGELLEKNGITLEENDRIDKDLSSDVENEMRINIERAKIVNVTIDGKIYKSFKTGCETIGQLMFEMGNTDNTEYILASDGLYSTKKIEDDMDISFSSVNVEITTETENIPYETVTVEDDTLEKGITQVKTKGEDGILTKMYKNTYIGGELSSTEEFSSEITKEAVNEVVVVGTYVKPVAKTVNTGSGTYTYSNEMTMRATGYCAYAPGCGLYTATGAVAKKGVVAVDKSVIPLGTKLYIPGYGEAIAADTGGAIKGDRIDLCFDSYDQAIQFGRNTMQVYILENKIS